MGSDPLWTTRVTRRAPSSKPSYARAYARSPKPIAGSDQRPSLASTAVARIAPVATTNTEISNDRCSPGQRASSTSLPATRDVAAGVSQSATVGARRPPASDTTPSSTTGPTSRRPGR